jgi:hypothetical protein
MAAWPRMASAHRAQASRVIHQRSWAGRPAAVTAMIPGACKPLQPTGGEQAVNPLQPAGTSRHTTTLDAKVAGMITASPLVMRRPCLFHTAAVAAREGFKSLGFGRSGVSSTRGI